MNSERIWKIQKKIVKRCENYGRKESRISEKIWKYGIKASWIVKRYEKHGRKTEKIWKYGRKQYKDIENTEERQVE